MNPIVILSELCQAKFRASMETRVISQSGPDHAPVITVEIELPDGFKYTASGCNQKEAKKIAAQKALDDLGF